LIIGIYVVLGAWNLGFINDLRATGSSSCEYRENTGIHK
jgi:hypothetical protein